VCLPDPPKTPDPAPPPAEAPRPLASPFPDDDEVGNLSQLRLGSRSNLRRSQRTGGDTGGTGAAAPAPAPAAGTGGDGRLTIPRTPPRGQAL